MGIEEKYYVKNILRAKIPKITHMCWWTVSKVLKMSI